MDFREEGREGILDVRNMDRLPPIYASTQDRTRKLLVCGQLSNQLIYRPGPPACCSLAQFDREAWTGRVAELGRRPARSRGLQTHDLHVYTPRPQSPSHRPPHPRRQMAPPPRPLPFLRPARAFPAAPQLPAGPTCSSLPTSVTRLEDSLVFMAAAALPLREELGGLLGVLP